LIAENAVWCDKSYFSVVFFLQLNLVVAGIRVQKGKPCAPCLCTSVFFLGTITSLDTQVDALISLMKHAFSSLCSSAAIVFLLGSSNRHKGCLTGFAFGSTFSACSMSFLGTPGMFEAHQAKISQRSWRNSTSTLSYVGSKFTAIEVVLSGSVG
jgi:hypothetical protein